MQFNGNLLLYPYEISNRDILTVLNREGNVLSGEYQIINENGATVRKGKLTGEGVSELKLCIVGFKRGTYTLKMGNTFVQFKVE